MAVPGAGAGAGVDAGVGVAACVSAEAGVAADADEKVLVLVLLSVLEKILPAPSAMSAISTPPATTGIPEGIRFIVIPFAQHFAQRSGNQRMGDW